MLTLGALQGVSLLLPLLSLPYLAQVLGPAALGRMALAFSLAQLLLVLSDYGFNLSAVKAVSVHRENPDRITAIWLTVTLIRLALALAGLVLLGLLAWLGGASRQDVELVGLACSLVLGQLLFPQWLFQGLETLRLVSALQIAARVLVFGLVFVAVQDAGDLRTATFLQGAGFLLGGLLTLPLTWRVLRRGAWVWPGRAQIMDELEQGWHVFVSTAATHFYTAGNAFVLGLLATPAAVGQFHVAEKMVRALLNLYASASAALLPHGARLAAQDPRGFFAFIGLLLRRLGGAALLVSALVCASAGWALGLLFGPAYQEAVLLLRLLSLLPVLVVLSNILGVQTLLPLGQEAAFSRVLLRAAGLNLLLFVPAAWLWGARGAALAHGAVELFVALGMWAHVRALVQNHPQAQGLSASLWRLGQPLRGGPA